MSFIIAEGQVELIVPPQVNVSEGQVAVVCFQADFSNVPEEERETIQLNVILKVEDIQTSKLLSPDGQVTS